LEGEGGESRVGFKKKQSAGVANPDSGTRELTKFPSRQSDGAVKNKERERHRKPQKGVRAEKLREKEGGKNLLFRLRKAPVTLDSSSRGGKKGILS